MTATAAPRTTDHTLGFTSLEREIVLDELPIAGTLPGWLEGSLLRTGPAKFEAAGRDLRHWFDGLAMLHRFSIGGGRVAYANRFLHSEAYEKARAGTLAREFGTDPCRSIFARAMSVFSPGITDNANVNITRLGERYLAMTETPMPIEFDPETLATLGHFRVEAKGDGMHTTAHPHHDHVRGALVNHTVHFSRRCTYRVYARGPHDAQRRIVGEHKVDKASYMHSFGLTERYAVLAEYPLVVDPLRLAFGGRPFIENYRWEPARGTRFLLFPLDGGEVLGPYETDAFFSFHHVNAFERDGEVVVDLCAYEDASIIDALYLDPLRRAQRPPAATLRRYRVPLDGGGPVDAEDLLPGGFELPRVNYRRHNARPYRYAWGVDAGGTWLDRIVKADVETGERREWSAEGCFPGEPVFVPAPGAGGEDEGVLLSVVLDAAREASSLLVLDARSLEELARAEVPHHIPHSFHGQFFGG